MCVKLIEKDRIEGHLHTNGKRREKKGIKEGKPSLICICSQREKGYLEDCGDKVERAVVGRKKKTVQPLTGNRNHSFN